MSPAGVRRSITALPLEAGAAQDRMAQVRNEGNGGGNAAFRAGDNGFYAPARVCMLRLAPFAVPQLMPGLLFPETELLTGAEDELLPSIHAPHKRPFLTASNRQFFSWRSRTPSMGNPEPTWLICLIIHYLGRRAATGFLSHLSELAVLHQGG